MPTIAYNGSATIYSPLQSTVTVTPGTGTGRVTVRGQTRTGVEFVNQTITAALDVSMSPGSTMTIACDGIGATYTEPVGLDTSLQALVSGGRILILNSQSAGADSGWLPLGAFPERFVYQLTSGSTSTTFQMDISADGVTSLGTAFTGVWASSTLAYITQPVAISNPLAKFMRWSVLTGGPLSLARYA